MTQTQEKLTCSDRVRSEWTSRRDDLYALYLTHDCGYVDDFLARQGYDDLSDEIRFYVDLDGDLYRIEYWFMDWFDGASLNVSSDETALAVFEDFNECGMIKVPENV